MIASQASSASATKLRRSRTGCNECRRLHHRCDETKPQCEACVRDGKTCSYARELAWVVDPTVKKTRRTKTRQSPQVAGSSSAGPAIPFADDIISQTQNDTNALVEHDQTRGRLILPGIPRSVDWLPWLSLRPRMLVHHFAQVTCATCCLDQTQHHQICAAILPLALDSTSGFHLLAAILSVASTHQRSLNMEQESATTTDAAYWEAMAVGHLHHQQLPHPGDEDAENAFAATALLLSVRDIFDGGERAKSWRMHLDGALFVLNRDQKGRSDAYGTTPNDSSTRLLLRDLAKAMEVVALLFSRPSIWNRHRSRQLPVVLETDSHSFNEASHDDDKIHKILGMSHEVLGIIAQVEEVATDMTSLMYIERTSTNGGDGMELLWQSLMRRVTSVISKSDTIGLALASITLSPDLTETEELQLLNKAFYHIALCQIQVRLLGLLADHPLVQTNLRDALTCLQHLRLRDHACAAMALLQPVFVIGCYAFAPEIQAQCLALLAALKQKYGRANAIRARDLLCEFWARRDQDMKVLPQGYGVAPCEGEGRRVLLPPRIEDYEWTDLMAEKGWDLSLW